jgi:alkylation response protein AidB-like acyl-CoA dehydrogenase
MYLAPDGDEIEIANAAADFLAEAIPIARLHGPEAADLDATQLRSMGEMGWFALAVPETLGGSGLSTVEHALFFREAGRQCAPVDLLAQCLAANIIDDAGLRQSVMSGANGVALIVADGADFRILGAANAAYALLVTADAARLYALAEVSTEVRPALDPVNSMRVAAVLGDPVESAEGIRCWQLGQLGTAAMLVGLAEASLDLIVEYAKVRETFGRKIGSWQAVRHPCADMAVRVEAARAQLWYAAAALKEGRTDAQVHLDAAKHMANLAALANTDSNIQLHGGIGVTDEHDAHLLLKHALTLSRLFGTKRSLLARLLDARLED